MSIKKEYEVRALDSLSWSLVLIGKRDRNVLTRKYLLEVLEKSAEIDSAIARELENIKKEYLSKLEQFFDAHITKVKRESSGELSLSFDSNNTWHHRKESVIIQSMFEFMLKRVCLRDGVGYAVALNRVNEE